MMVKAVVSLPNSSVTHQDTHQLSVHTLHSQVRYAAAAAHDDDDEEEDDDDEKGVSLEVRPLKQL